MTFVTLPVSRSQKLTKLMKTWNLTCGFPGHVNFCERARQGSELVDDYLRRAENAAAAATAARTTSTAATTSGQFNENPLAASAKAWTPAT